MTKTIRSRTGSSGIFCVVRWMTDQLQFLRGAGEKPHPQLLLTDWGINASSSEDAVMLIIDPNHGPRVFDPAIVAFMRLATAFTGSIGLNSVGTEEVGDRRLYPVVRTYAGKNAETGASIKTAIYVDRLTVDAPRSSIVKERDDYRDRRYANLRTEAAPDQRGSKFTIGRREGIDLVLEAYDRWCLSGRMPVNREDYESFLWLALNLQDASVR